MTKIIDIIQHKSSHGTQMFLVVDAPISLKYERSGGLLIGEDSGFFYFYKHEKPSRNFQAFAGRKFDIPLKDGGVVKACGQWWSCAPDDYSELTYSIGVAAVDELNACYVFRSTYVDKKIVDDWLSKNEPSNNYYKYEKKSKAYGKHKI